MSSSEDLLDSASDDSLADITEDSELQQLEDSELQQRVESPLQAPVANIQSLDNTELSKTIEICGLKESSNGRMCSTHAVCGEHVKINDILRLKECIVEVNNTLEPAIKLVKIAEGSETCTVAFIPRIYYSLPKVRNGINGTLQAGYATRLNLVLFST